MLKRLSGGYHDYESVRPLLLNSKMYSCNNPQFIDTFIYFSHKLVCVPPSTWVNAMHRHGVKVLGAFVVEPGTRDIERMLDHVNDKFPLAKQLADMAFHFGFDGWLLNVELEFPQTSRDVTGKMTAFIRNLKCLLGPEGRVVWYDALTVDNEIDYQNGLTEENALFALAADALFTNYKWTHKSLHEAKAVGDTYGMMPSETSFGIDVWAQNTSMQGPPRVTFPRKGGGGTNTGLVSLNELVWICLNAVNSGPRHRTALLSVY